MIRVVATGSECTGKTTLARALAEHYAAPLVGEYARDFVRDKGTAPGCGDVEAIARGQIKAEKAAWTAAPHLLIQDTDLLSTVIYGRHYYGHCPGWIVEAQEDSLPDLYLLCGIDVPWIPDGDQRDRPDRREEMHELFRSAVSATGVKFLEISTSREERWNAATAAVDRLLSGSAVPEGAASSRLAT